MNRSRVGCETKRGRAVRGAVLLRSLLVMRSHLHAPKLRGVPFFVPYYRMPLFVTYFHFSVDPTQSLHYNIRGEGDQGKRKPKNLTDFLGDELWRRAC